MSAQIIPIRRILSSEREEQARAAATAARLEGRRLVADFIDSDGFIDSPWALADAIANAIHRAANGVFS